MTITKVLPIDNYEDSGADERFATDRFTSELHARCKMMSQNRLARLIAAAPSVDAEPWNTDPDGFDFAEEAEWAENDIPWQIDDGDESYLSADIDAAPVSTPPPRVRRLWAQAADAIVASAESASAHQEDRVDAVTQSGVPARTSSSSDAGPASRNASPLNFIQDEIAAVGPSYLAQKIRDCSKQPIGTVGCGVPSCPRCSKTFAARALYEVCAAALARHEENCASPFDDIHHLTIIHSASLFLRGVGLRIPERAIKAFRKKLNRLARAEPNVRLSGMIQVELIKLGHVLEGLHGHSIKGPTISVLLTEPSSQVEERDVSPDDPEHLVEVKRIEEVYRYLKNGEMPPDDQFPDVGYALVVHMHAVVMLNGTPRADFEMALRGRSTHGTSTRRHKGLWRGEYQVKLQELRSDRPLCESLVRMVRYPYKLQTEFKYEKSVLEPVRIPFTDEEFAFSIWLQYLIGHEGLRVSHNMNPVDPSRDDGSIKRGRKRKSRQSIGNLPDEKTFIKEAVEIMRRRERLDLWLEQFFPRNDELRSEPVSPVTWE